MLKIASFVLFILCSFCVLSQKYIKPYIGLNFSNRILTSSYSERKDSLDHADKTKIFAQGGIQFLFEKKPGREFYFGINYHENGFVRERFDYHFKDTVHPQLGQIFDLSQGAQKNAFFTYHFKYLEIPIGCNFQVTPRQYMNTFTGWFNIGLVPQLLLKQNMTIFLQGFSMKGKTRFNLNNTGYDAAKINMALQTGGRFDVNIKGKFWVTTDAMLRIQLLNSASSPNEKLRVWNFGANLGLRYEIGDY